MICFVEHPRLWLGIVTTLIVAINAYDGMNDYDYIVDKDGHGDYKTIQAAIDGAKSFPSERITIFIKEGLYKEKLKIHSWNTSITLLGESKEGTVITHADHFDAIDRGRNSTFFTYTMNVQGNDSRVRNLTVRNESGPVGQAVALHVESDRSMFKNCCFIGNQDTVYAAGEGAKQYFDECYIEGTTDFIFGNATAVFENCRLHSKSDSYIAAASTPQGQQFGYVFLGCTLTADSDITEVYLGRPWRDHAQTVFIRSQMGSHIHPAGWHNWSRPEAEQTVLYAEYDSRGPGAREDSERVSWSEKLTQSDTARYTKKNIFTEQNSREPTTHWYRKNS